MDIRELQWSIMALGFFGVSKAESSKKIQIISMTYFKNMLY